MSIAATHYLQLSADSTQETITKLSVDVNLN